MTLKEVDGTRLLFNIHSDSLVDDFKAKIPEFTNYEGNVEEKKVIQYIILMADMASPLRIEKPDYYQRKYASAMMVRFPTTKKEFVPDAESILIGDNEVVNQSMVAYILSYGLPSFALLQAYMALMSFEMQKIFGGKQTKDSQKIIDGANDRIQNLTRDFFKSGDYDEYSKVRQVLYSRVEKEREKLRPEQLIRILEDTGELPEDFNPYGDYKIDLAKDLLFVGDGSK